MMPARIAPSPSCSTPAITTAVRNASHEPSVASAVATMAVRPAAGPLTISCEPLISATTRPPITPEMSPGRERRARRERDAKAERQCHEEHHQAGREVGLPRGGEPFVHLWLDPHPRRAGGRGDVVPGRSVPSWALRLWSCNDAPRLGAAVNGPTTPRAWQRHAPVAPRHTARGRSRVQVVVEGLADRWGTRGPRAVAALTPECHAVRGAADDVDDRRADGAGRDGRRQDAGPLATLCRRVRAAFSAAPWGVLPGGAPLRRACRLGARHPRCRRRPGIPVRRRRHMGMCRAEQRSAAAPSRAWIRRRTDGPGS